MLEKTVYLTSLYLASDRTALAIQVLAAVLPALIIGMVAFSGKTRRALMLAVIQVPIYWGLAELTTGEWFFFWYKLLKPVIAWLGGDIYSRSLTDMLIIYGVPGLAHGIIAAAACLWLWWRATAPFKDRAKAKAGARAGKR
jgi:ABC-type Fe3+-siderophore transport system permease subunit